MSKNTLYNTVKKSYARNVLKRANTHVYKATTEFV